VGAGAAVVAASPASINAGVAYLNPEASQYFIRGQKVPASLSAFAVDSSGNIIPKGMKTETAFKSYSSSTSIDSFNTSVADLFGFDDDDDGPWVRV
jgi:hypothetical protein